MVCIIDNRIINKPIPIYYYTQQIQSKTYNKFDKCNQCNKLAEYKLDNHLYCWEHAQSIDYKK